MSDELPRSMRMKCPPAPKVVIECDGHTYSIIAGTIHNALAGKPVIFGDNLEDLVKRHCPEVYGLAASHGYKLVPNLNCAYMEQSPPQVWFDVVRADE
jgi:hypothetical protein